MKINKLEENKSAYKKLYKRELEQKAKIKCGRCPYHKKENAVKQQKTWKKKRKTHFKIKETK